MFKEFFLERFQQSHCEWGEGEGNKKDKTKEDQTDLQEMIKDTEEANVTKELRGTEVTRALWLVP